MRFAGSDGALTCLFDGVEALVFLRGVDAGNHVAKKVGNVEPGGLNVPQLIGEEEDEHRSLLIFLGQLGRRLIGNRGAGRLSLFGNADARSVIFRLLQPRPLS